MTALPEENKKPAARILQANVAKFGINGLSTIVFRFGKALYPYGIVFDYYAGERITEEQQEYIQAIRDMQGRLYDTDRTKNKLDNLFRGIREFRECVRNNGYSTVQIHADSAYSALRYCIGARQAGAKRIIVHSHAAGINADSTAKRMAHAVCKRILPRLATDLVSCSDLAAKHMYPVRLLSKVRIIPNGIETEAYRFDPETRKTVRTELGVADDIILIGHIGRFCYQKNQEYLVKILREMEKTGRKYRLLLIGMGETEETIDALMTSAGQKEKVIHIRSTDRVPEYMSAMDVFVLPSRFEGLPVVGVEAQSAGLPCLFADTITKQADITGLVSFLPIEDENAGLWAEQILKSADSDREKRKAAAELVARNGYSVGAAAEKLLELYRDGNS